MLSLLYFNRQVFITKDRFVIAKDWISKIWIECCDLYRFSWFAIPFLWSCFSTWSVFCYWKMYIKLLPKDIYVDSVALAAQSAKSITWVEAGWGAISGSILKRNRKKKKNVSIIGFKFWFFFWSRDAKIGAVSFLWPFKSHLSHLSDFTIKPKLRTVVESVEKSPIFSPYCKQFI